MNNEIPQSILNKPIIKIAGIRKYSQFICILFFLLSISCSLFAQEKDYVKHTVTKGETIKDIAARYKVTPYDIYKLNPDSQAGIKEKDIILIPAASHKNMPNTAAAPKPQAASSNPKTHVATAKETLYSIARDYKVSIQDLQGANPGLFEAGLKIGQTVNIPGGGGKVAAGTVVELKHTPVIKKVEAKPSAASADNVVYHIVEPKETKFGIAKKYGMTVKELEEKNPAIAANLPVGYKLIVSGSAKAEGAKPEATKPKPVTHEIVGVSTVQTQTTHKILKNGFANYEVKPKETIYSLTKAFDLT